MGAVLLLRCGLVLASELAMPSQFKPENLCSELVNVLYEDRSWRTRSTLANLESISADHAVLLSDERLQTGSHVAFEAQGHDLYGTVESAEVDKTLGCFIKVQLDANSRWHGRMFVPEHFLALCAFAQPAAEWESARSPKAFTLSDHSGS